MTAWLIEPEALQEALAKHSGLRVLDCRFDLSDAERGLQKYRRQHIPGAVYAHLDRDLSGLAVPGVTGRHPLPGPEALQATLRHWGIDTDTHVVVYDGGNSMFAARAWWVLRWAGVRKVQVLNGGWQAWLNQGLPVDTDNPEPEASHIEVSCPEEWVVNADDIMRNPGAYTLLDARAPARFTGASEPMDARGGHIPGAICADFTSNLDESARFRSVQELRQLFSQMGDVPITELASPTAYARLPVVVSYCGSGVTACHNILAMMIAGLPQPKLYPGSWSDWINDDRRPIATGA